MLLREEAADDMRKKVMRNRPQHSIDFDDRQCACGAKLISGDFISHVSRAFWRHFAIDARLLAGRGAARG